MKKIISRILFSDLDNTPGIWYNVPMIPASGTFSSESEKKGPGRLRTVKLSFKLYSKPEGIDRNISLVVEFDDGSREIVGTNDIPAALTITNKGYLEASCKWEYPE